MFLGCKQRICESLSNHWVKSLAVLLLLHSSVERRNNIPGMEESVTQEKCFKMINGIIIIIIML